jgi:hypothetical protein
MATLGVRTGPFSRLPAAPDCRPDEWIDSVGGLAPLLETGGLAGAGGAK